MRRATLLLALLALACLAACSSTYCIKPEEVAGEPTEYCRVISPPDPVLMGYWRRIPPGEYNRPHTFNYWLVKKGDKYALFYHWDDKRGHVVHGWCRFTIDGPTMDSSEDPSTYFVKNGSVYHNYGGRKFDSPMMKLHD